MTIQKLLATPIVFARCASCGDDVLCQEGLCRECREIRTWSRINRDFCALIHREAGGARPPSLVSVRTV
jgi:hypothetical protein